mgnify:CR=1 FL=1
MPLTLEINSDIAKALHKCVVLLHRKYATEAEEGSALYMLASACARKPEDSAEQASERKVEQASEKDPDGRREQTDDGSFAGKAQHDGEQQF